MNSPRVVVILGMLALLTACGGSGTSSLPSFYTDSYSTPATYYTSYSAGGACGFGAPADSNITAVSVPLYSNSDVCGAYIQVTGDQGTATVKVIDECTGGPCDTSDQLDLSDTVFSAITTSVGTANVTWKYVEGPVGSSTIELYWGSSLSPYYLDVVVDNIRHPVATVELQDSSSAFVSLTRSTNNHFAASPSGSNTFPTTTLIRLTDKFGNQVEDSVTWSASSTTTTTVQFPAL